MIYNSIVVMLKKLILAGRNSPGWGLPLAFVFYVAPPMLGWSELEGVAHNAVLLMVVAWSLSLLIDDGAALRGEKVSVRSFLSIIPAAGCFLVIAVYDGAVSFGDSETTGYVGLAALCIVAFSYMAAAARIWTRKYRGDSGKSPQGGASKFNFDGVDAAFFLAACLLFVFWDNAYAEGFPAYGRIAGGVIFALWAWRRIRQAARDKHNRKPENFS